jgi:hypothetical protein
MYLRLRCRLVINWNDDAPRRVDCSQYGAFFHNGGGRNSNSRRNGF